MGAFQLLLYRLSRQTDLVVGIPTSGQAAAGFESLVGHCVHVLPLRTLFDPDKRVAQHLSELHSAMLDGLDHQQTTFTELLHKLKRPRDPSRPALIQVAFGMGRSQKRPSFARLDTFLYVVPRVSETFELYVYATDVGGALEVSWSYSTDLFSEATIARVAALLRHDHRGADRCAGRAHVGGDLDRRSSPIVSACWSARGVRASRIRRTCLCIA